VLSCLICILGFHCKSCNFIDFWRPCTLKPNFIKILLKIFLETICHINANFAGIILRWSSFNAMSCSAVYTKTWQSLLKIVIPTLLNITRLSDLLFFRKVPSDQTFLEPEFWAVFVVEFSEKFLSEVLQQIPCTWY
jgi:hypothetical protein